MDDIDCVHPEDTGVGNASFQETKTYAESDAESSSRLHEAVLTLGGDDPMTAVFRSCVSHEELLRRMMAMTTCDFTRTEMNVMTTLFVNGPLAMTPLSECIGSSNEQASRAVKSLAEGGYVERRRGERDQRVIVAQLTEKGTGFLDGFLKQVLAALDELLEALPDEERDEFVQLSHRSDELLDKALESRRNPFPTE